MLAAPTTVERLSRTSSPLDSWRDVSSENEVGAPGRLPGVVVPFGDHLDPATISDGFGPLAAGNGGYRLGDRGDVPTGVPGSSRAVLPDNVERYYPDSGRPSLLDRLAVPDGEAIELSVEALRDGDVHTLLETALNSEGDSVAVRLEVGASVLTPIGAVGGRGEIEAKIVRTEDGRYEISITAASAATLGLEVSEELGVEVEQGVEARVVFGFDTLEEAERGLWDLTIVAGGADRIEQLADTTATVTEFADDVLNSRAGDNWFTDRIDDVVSVVPGVDRPFETAREATDAIADATEQLAEFVGGAQERLNDARESVEVSHFTGADAKLGLPEDPLSTRELGIDLSAQARYTTRFNEDGTITVSATQSASASGGGSIDGFGVEGDARGSVTVSQTFERDGLNLEPIGEATVSLVIDSSGSVTTGVGAGGAVTGNAGGGVRATYTFEVSELENVAGGAIAQLLRGDVDGAIETLGDVEGDLTIQARVTGGGEVSVQGSRGGNSVSGTGRIDITDQGTPVEFEDVSIVEAFEFIESRIPYDNLIPA